MATLHKPNTVLRTFVEVEGFVILRQVFDLNIRISQRERAQ